MTALCAVFGGLERIYKARTIGGGGGGGGEVEGKVSIREMDGNVR